MSADEQIRQAAAQLGHLTDAVFLGIATETLRSIVDGSELTGAPGQPVDTGYLKGSWQLTYPTPDQAQIATRADYAEAVEDAVGPHGPRAYGAERDQVRQAKGGSIVGGSHSVSLTVAGLPQLARVVTERVVSQQGGG